MTLPMKLAYGSLFVLLALVFAASMAIVVVRNDGRRLQTELGEAEREGNRLEALTPWLRVQLATQSNPASVYLDAINQGLVVPSLSDGSLRYLMPLQGTGKR